MSPFGSSERDSLYSMLRSMLSFRLEGRPSAQPVLESEWMAKWALPEYEKLRSTHNKRKALLRLSYALHFRLCMPWPKSGLASTRMWQKNMHMQTPQTEQKSAFLQVLEEILFGRSIRQVVLF
ncbi:hypothetical protein BO82DRAFT_195199 [Aspergillus uvarum CBS 121591]|uniref:Uncharacterized protein n=1 Tax=Aspergillus uvarum CBS 121591 TaxID=1448315 RepID=A0A319BT53_9EURO|nr:hypothetical protein BO82DRAFT_195199 [Aspergillus uvarum CBS 121591]PYH76786.1 hypothetical protein BO82DRAFT_195199 [Aspergillus uvarum CBS 121591]